MTICRYETVPATVVLRKPMTHPAPVSIIGGGRFFFAPPKRHAHRESPQVATSRVNLATSGDQNSPLLWTTNAQVRRMITPDLSRLQRPVDVCRRSGFAAVTG